MTDQPRKQVEPPRAFPHFPDDSVCPVCKTSDDGECVLIPIVGTQDGSIFQAKPMHLACAIPQWYDEVNEVIYRKL